MDVLSKVVVFIKSCKKLSGKETCEVKSSDAHKFDLCGRNSSVLHEKKNENLCDDVESTQNTIKLSTPMTRYSKPKTSLDDNRNFTSNGSCEKILFSTFENETKKTTNNSLTHDSLTTCGNLFYLRSINSKKQRVDKNSWSSANQLQNGQCHKHSKNLLNKVVITKQITGSCCRGLNTNSFKRSKIPCMENSTVYLNYANRRINSEIKTLPILSSANHQDMLTMTKVNGVLFDINEETNIKTKSKFQSTISNGSNSRQKEPFTAFFKGRSRSNEEKSSRKKKVNSFGQVSLNGNEITGNRFLYHACKCRQHSEEILGSPAISRSDMLPKPWAFTLRCYDKSPSPICSRKSTPERSGNHQSRVRINSRKGFHHSVIVKDTLQTEIKYKPPFLSYTLAANKFSNGNAMTHSCFINPYEMPGKFMKGGLNKYKYKLLYSQKTSERVPESISSCQNLPLHRKPRLIESAAEPMSSNSVKITSLNKIPRTLNEPLPSNLPSLETKVNLKNSESSTYPRIKNNLKIKNTFGNNFTNQNLGNFEENNFNGKGKEKCLDIKTDEAVAIMSKDMKFVINQPNNCCFHLDSPILTDSSVVMEQNSCKNSKQKAHDYQDRLKKQSLVEKVDSFINKCNDSNFSIYARGLKILKKTDSYAKLIDDLHLIYQSGFNINNVLASLISQKFIFMESESQQLFEPFSRTGNINVKDIAEAIEEIKNNRQIYLDKLFDFTPSSENFKLNIKYHKTELEKNLELFWYDFNLLNNKESFICDMESNAGNLKSTSIEFESSLLDNPTHITSVSLATLDSDFDIFESSLVEFEPTCPSHLTKELEDVSFRSDSILKDENVYKSKKGRGYLRDAFRCMQPNPSFQSNFELCYPSKFKQKQVSGTISSLTEKQRTVEVSSQAFPASYIPIDSKTTYSSHSLPIFKKYPLLSKSFQNMCIPMFRQRSYSKSGDIMKKSWQSLAISGKIQSQRSYSCFGQTSTYSPDSDHDISVSTNSSFKNKFFSKSSDQDSFFSSIFASPRFKRKKMRNSSLFSDSNPFETQIISSVDLTTDMLSYHLNERKSSNLGKSFSVVPDYQQEKIVNVNKYKKYQHGYRSGYSSTSPIPPLAVFSSDEDISVYPLRHVSSEPNYCIGESDNSFKRFVNLNRSTHVDKSSMFLGNKFRTNKRVTKFDYNLKSLIPASNLEWKRDLQFRLSYSRPILKKYSAKDISCRYQKEYSLTSSDQLIKMMSQPCLMKAREWFSSDICSNILFYSLPNITGKDADFILSNSSLQSRISLTTARLQMLSNNNSLSSSGASSNNTFSLSRSILKSKNTFVEALWDFVSLDREELTFYAGDIILVVEFPEKTWWWGKLGDKIGWFPSSHVVFLTTKEIEVYERIQMAASSRLSQHHNTSYSQVQPKSYNCFLHSKASDQNNFHHNHHHINHQDVGIISIASSSSSSSSHDLTRRCVMNELIKAEKDYVKHLKDIIEGYLRNCEEHKEMFTPEQISKIFSNIEGIHNFSNKFLKELKVQIIEEMVEFSCIGKCFIDNRRGFEIYSDYCNNHSIASQILLTLRKIHSYQDFFENCRKEQKMIEIPLEGFLLTPIQKICKYPLQLKELLRFTAQHHKDYDDLKVAIDVMRNIVSMINEIKRRTEERQNLFKWQNSIIHWQGTNITDLSTELIHSGELVKMNPKGWHQQRFCFLFDHQMVLCKKDLPWKATLTYKGRINMDLAVLHIDELQTLRNSFRLLESSGKVTIWLCKSSEDLKKWIEALRKERFIINAGIKTN